MKKIKLTICENDDISKEVWTFELDYKEYLIWENEMYRRLKMWYSYVVFDIDEAREVAMSIRHLYEMLKYLNKSSKKLSKN
jgi:hypothetical protein